MASRKSKFDRDRLTQDLRVLSGRFEVAGNALLTGTDARTAIGDIRDHLTEAGRCLLKALHSGGLAQPSEVPPWLRFSLRGLGPRPRFVGEVLQTDIGVVEAIEGPKTLSQVLLGELANSDAVRQHARHRATDLRLGYIRRRLVFLEAITGWLSDALKIKPRLHAPRRTLLVRSRAGGEQRVDLCFDLLPEEDRETHQFFLSVTRCASRACDLLAQGLRKQFWHEIEQDIEDEETRGHLRALVEQQSQSGTPTDDKILDTLRDRQHTLRLRSELRQILEASDVSPAGICERWRALAKWGLRMFAQRSRDGNEVVDFKMAAFGESMYPYMGSSERLDWARALKAATKALIPLATTTGFDAAGRQPLHILVRDMNTVLRGRKVDIERQVGAVSLIIDDLLSSVTRQQDPESPGVRWVPASRCIDDERKDATAVRRFCEAHGVRTLKPKPNRLDVDFNDYQAKARLVRRSAEKAIDGIGERHLAEKRRKEQGPIEGG